MGLWQSLQTNSFLIAPDKKGTENLSDNAFAFFRFTKTFIYTRCFNKK